MAYSKPPKNKFSRQSIDLTPHGKVWRDAPVQQLSVGDLVRDRGAIASIKAEPSGFVLEFVDGKSQFFPGLVLVHAFTAKES